MILAAILGAISGAAVSGSVLKPTTTVVFDGNSLTRGYGSTPTPPYYDYPSQTLRLLNAVSITAAYNFGVDGQNTLDMSGDAATQVDSLFDATKNNVVCVWEGTNALNTVGATTAFAQLKAYCLDRKAAGWTVVILTIIPIVGNTYFNGARSEINNSIREQYLTFSDAVADVGDIPDLDYYDGTHLTDTGYGQIAAVVAPVLATLLNL